MLTKSIKVTFVLTFILILTPLLTACWNSEELDKMSYIHSLGIDYKNGQYNVYIQVINFAYLTNQSASTSQNLSQAVVGVGVGKTVVDAIDDVYSKTSRRMYWGHLSSVIFTKEGLKHGLQPTLDLFSRYHEIRYTLWVYSTKESLKEILTTYPPTEQSEVYSRIGDPEDAYSQASFIKPLRMFEVIRNLYEPGGTVILPEISLGKNNWMDNKSSTPGLTLDHATILNKYHIEGNINPNESKGLMFYKGANRFFVYIKINDQRNVTLTFSNPKSKVVAHFKNGEPSFDLYIKAKAIIEELDNRIPIDDLQKKSVSQISDSINRTYQTGLKKDMDIYNLSHVFYLKYPQIWHKLEKKGEIPLNEGSVHVHVNLKLINSYKAYYKPLFGK